MSFSQRMGLTPVRSIAQTDGMDRALRNALWDVLHLNVWRRESNAYEDVEDSVLRTLFDRIWHLHLKRPIDRMPSKVVDAIELLRDLFFKWTWFEVYDFIEFVAHYIKDQSAISAEHFESMANAVLEREMSGFRLSNGLLVRISSNEELKSIEEALENTSPYKGAQEHLVASLALLSDRKNPDFRNSMKEAISAVESICQVITGDSKATLGAALKTIEKYHPIHPALKKSLEALYGYSSDSNGIRHALQDESNVTFDDAKFMLVSCTAFVNYLVAKSVKQS